MENPNRSEHSPTRMKVLIVGDEGVGKYSLRAQAAWSAALTDGVYRTCVIDHSHISLEIPISRPPFQSETSVSSTETSSNARLAGKCLNWVNNLVKWVNGKISLILQPEEVQMKLEMSVLLYTPSPNEDQLRSNELYLRHSSVVALCYHIARPETLDNAINKWHPFIRHHLPTVPIILVGCQSDRLQPAVETVVSGSKTRDNQGKFHSQKAVKIVGAVEHLQCFVKDIPSIKLVFNTLAWFGYHQTRQNPWVIEPFQRSEQ